MKARPESMTIENLCTALSLDLLTKEMKQGSYDALIPKKPLRVDKRKVKGLQM